MSTIQQQISAVEREIAMRRRVFPRRVAERKVTQEWANNEIAHMEAALATLIRVRDGERHGPIGQLETSYPAGAWSIERRTGRGIGETARVRLFGIEGEIAAEAVAWSVNQAVTEALENHRQGVKPAIAEPEGMRPSLIQALGLDVIEDASLPTGVIRVVNPTTGETVDIVNLDLTP